MKAKFILAIAIVFCIAGLVAFDVYRNSPMIQNPKRLKKNKKARCETNPFKYEKAKFDERKYIG